MFHKACEYNLLSLLLAAEDVSREIRLRLASKIHTDDLDMSGIWSTGTDWSTFICSNSIFFFKVSVDKYQWVFFFSNSGLHFWLVGVPLHFS